MRLLNIVFEYFLTLLIGSFLSLIAMLIVSFMLMPGYLDQEVWPEESAYRQTLREVRALNEQTMLLQAGVLKLQATNRGTV
jgi:Na+/H+ antiporter NhaD/arsenite permease-like protein